MRPRRRSMGVGQVERVLLLRTFPGFADIPAENIASIAEHINERHFPTGEYLHRQSMPVTALYLIVHGRVELIRNGRSIRELGEKTAVGGIVAFANDSRGYDVIAREDVVALEILVEDMFDIFEDHFPILRNVMQRIAGELLDARRTLPGTAGYSAPRLGTVDLPDRPLDLVERIGLVRQSFAFAKSRLDAVAELAREAAQVRFPAGSVLWNEGDPSDHMLIVVSGLVLCRTIAKQAFGFGPGDVVGSIDAAAARPRWFTARADTEVVGLRIDTEALYDVFEDDFEMALDLVGTMANGLMWTLDHKVSLSPPPP